jgi:putative two-component system response regulator
MHDIGKIGVADAILKKPGKLTDDEFNQIKEHTTIGARILEGSQISLLNLARDIALHHHEKWNGSGYPMGISGEAIPLGARIVAACDVYDALVSDRIYRPALSEAKALAIMREGRGSHFDPQVLDVFLDQLPQIHAIRERLKE